MRILLHISFIAFYLFACHPENTPLQRNTDFIGSWKLLKWTTELEDGSEVFPYGENAYGRLVYQTSGEMTGILMADNRALMTSNTPATRSPEEALAAFNSFFAYSGPYEIRRDSGFVLHHVESCINPNWVGRVQKRFFSFEEGKLILSTPPIEVPGSENQARKQVLIWERVDGS